MTALPAILNPEPDDNEDVVSALETADIFWNKGDTDEALRWLKRAAETASDTGNDMRALAIARSVADLEGGRDARRAPRRSGAKNEPTSTAFIDGATSRALGAGGSIRRRSTEQPCLQRAAAERHHRCRQARLTSPRRRLPRQQCANPRPLRQHQARRCRSPPPDAGLRIEWLLSRRMRERPQHHPPARQLRAQLRPRTCPLVDLQPFPAFPRSLVTL